MRRLHDGALLRASAIAVITTVLLASCAASLPSSVIEGSTVRVGWSETLTSLNAATTTGDTAGNREVAAATHDAFARIVGGEVVEDTGFGSVEVLDDDPASFTVRYDLADRAWSDGIPIDGADLLLAWAAGSGATDGAFESVAGALRLSDELPEIDDFERRLDVSFAAPVRGWHTALDVAVPAHVVGELALGIEDPMEAKQAVIDAITDGNEEDLAEIARVWSSAFDVTSDSDLSESVTVGSGPYLLTEVGGGGGDLRLEVNRAYDGDSRPAYERIDVVASDDPLAAFPDDLDIVRVSPTPENFVTVRDLERRDNHVVETHVGQLWTLALRADTGVFRSRAARKAFLRATPAADIRSGGAGAWDSSYAASQSLLFAPESDGYEIALEDAGFREAFEATTTDVPIERDRAGVAAGTEVCVLHDNDSAFAVGAFNALKASLADTGWIATDCGQPDISAALEQGTGWQAVLTTVALPQTPADIATTWGGKEPSPLTGLSSKKCARLVTQLDETADVYDGREVQVKIEAGLIKEAVALPLTLDPVVTLSSRDMNAVLPGSGASTTLLGGAAVFEPASGR